MNKFGLIVLSSSLMWFSAFAYQTDVTCQGVIGADKVSIEIPKGQNTATKALNSEENITVTLGGSNGCTFICGLGKTIIVNFRGQTLSAVSGLTYDYSLGETKLLLPIISGEINGSKFSMNCYE